MGFESMFASNAQDDDQRVWMPKRLARMSADFRRRLAFVEQMEAPVEKLMEEKARRRGQLRLGVGEDLHEAIESYQRAEQLRRSRNIDDLWKSWGEYLEAHEWLMKHAVGVIMNASALGFGVKVIRQPSAKR